MLPLVLVFLVAVNALTIWRFRDDKLRAMAGERRVAEADLLGLAIVGGTPGAYFARHRYRHKTRKQPFSTCLAVIGACQAGVLLQFLF